jgi:hypothetical protein
MMDTSEYSEMETRKLTVAMETAMKEKILNKMKKTA